MANDLYYFYESDFSKGNLIDFYNSLPVHIRAKFVDSIGGMSVLDRDVTNVVQGYRGPRNNGSSGDSKYLGSSNGLQEVKFWFGVSKHLNWVPIVGSIVYGIARAAGDTAWHSLYFDSNTGECLSHDKNEAAQRLNEIGNEHHQAGRYEQALEYYQNAYLNNRGNSHNDAVYKANRANTLIQFGRYEDSIAEADTALRLDSGYDWAKNTKARAYSAWASKLWDEKKYIESAAKYKLAYETCTSGYEHEQLYRNNWHNSQAEAYNQEGHRLKGLDNRFQEAISEYERAYNECPDVEGVYRNNRKIYQNNKAQAFNAWGMQLEQEGKESRNTEIKKQRFEAARLKFEEAERATTDQSNKDIYKNNQALMLSKIGNVLFDNGDYSGAVDKYGAAYSKCTNSYSERQTFLDNQRKAQTEITAKAAFEQAERLYSSGDYDGALNKYREAIDLTSDAARRAIYKNAQANSLGLWGKQLEQEGKESGNTEIKKQRFEAARLKFEEAERVTTDQSSKTTYRNNQGLMLSKIGDILHTEANRLEGRAKINRLREAIGAYDRAIELNTAKAVKYRGERSSIEQTITREEGILRNNQQAEELFVRANAMVANDDTKIATYQEAINLTSDAARRAIYKNAQANSLGLWGKQLEQEGKESGNTEIKKQRFEAARLKFEEAERVTTDQSSRTTYRKNQAIMLNKIGDILHSNGDYTGAIQKYDAAIALQNDKVYHANKASSLIELGSYEDAIAEADRALGLDSGYEWAKNTKARVYNAWGLAFHKSGNYNKAIQCFTNAISLVDEATYHYNRQLAFEALQKLQTSLAEQEVKPKVEKEHSSDSVHFTRIIDGSCNVPSSDAIIRNLQTHGNLNINSCVSIYAKSLLNKPMGFFIKRDCPFYTYTREDILSIIDVLEVEINTDDIRIDNMSRDNPGTEASLKLLSELSNDCSLFRDQQTLLTYYVQKRYELYVRLVKKEHNSSISSKSFNISDVLNKKQLLELLDNLYVIDSSSIDYINSILLNSRFLVIPENDKSHITDLYLKHYEPKIKENNLIKVLASKTYDHIQNVLAYLFNLKAAIKTGDLDEVKSEIISECNLTDSEFDTLSSNLIYHLDDERRVFNEWVSVIEQQILGEIVE
jgi:tetratricopeptide (TPR) repeat protein